MASSSSLPQEFTQTEASLQTLEDLLNRAKQVQASSQTAYQQLSEEKERLIKQEQDLRQQVDAQKAEQARLNAELGASRALLSTENLERLTRINSTLTRVNALLRGQS